MRNKVTVVVFGCAAVLSFPLVVAAQDKSIREQQVEIEAAARKLGPWEKHSFVVQEAMGNVFDRQGWNSPEDRFARGLIERVDQYPPWQYKERQQVFMGSLQDRYGLSSEQQTQITRNMHTEFMAIAVKHFQQTAPIAMEVIKTRAEQKPFSQEQIQRWSKVFEPIMEDARQSMERITGNLKQSMTPEQIAQLDADVGALMKRHQDVAKMVQKWKQGQWDPRDWGLQNDPIHQPMMGEIYDRDIAIQQEKDWLEFDRPLWENKAQPRDYSTWEKYVRHFCKFYRCDEGQVVSAKAILKNCEGRARSTMKTNERLVKLFEDRIAGTSSADEKRNYQSQLDAEHAKIEAIFRELCLRLNQDVTTTEQKQLYGQGMNLPAGQSVQPVKGGVAGGGEDVTRN